MRWLGELANHDDEYKTRDIGVVGIAADDVADMVGLQPRIPTITLLTDVKLAGSLAWGLVPAGAEEPEPGTFIIDREGVIRYQRLGNEKGDWPTYAEVAAALH
ncbi:MAG: redoxin domain-containing protein [Polyangiales bacterium]